LNIKPQKGKELIVEWHRSGHVFNGYLDVVNDRLHCISQIVAQPPPNETVLSHSESFREQARWREHRMLGRCGVDSTAAQGSGDWAGAKESTSVVFTSSVRIQGVDEV